MTRGAAPAEVPYGRLDRLLHRVGFASLGVQRSLAEFEHDRFRARIDPAHARRPVLVTSLPRAGTTVLLQALAEQPELAAASYRHMPFPLLPLLWSETTQGVRRAERRTERAHGDGVAVGFDSPEAFEEPVWMAFWPDHYRGERILPWAPNAHASGFAEFFRRHMAKVVAAGRPGATRYLSKNNASIARLGLIDRLFPDATVVVPVRHPHAQAASLHRQHLRFAELHARDRFARRYMEGLGHFEFGAALRPIAFGADPPDPAGAASPAFWLRYWADAYEAVLTTAGERTVFVDHDVLSADPARLLPPLADALDLADPDALGRQAQRFRPPRPAEPPEAPAPLLARAAELYAALVARCLKPEPLRKAANAR